MYEERDFKIYKSLFQKVNLVEHVVFIPKYLQPLTYMAIETDAKIQILLEMMCYVGRDVHLKEFKNFVSELEQFEKDKDGNKREVKFLSKSTLNLKLRTMELIGLIEIKGYRIRLTSQALSYYNDVYTKTESRATFEAKLEKVTRAKLLAFTSSLVVVKNNEDLERKNIYRYSPDGFVVIQSNENESIMRYKSKLYTIKDIIINEELEKMDEFWDDNTENKDIESKNFKADVLEDTDVIIHIEENIYSNYKNDIDNVFEDKILFKEIGYRVVMSLTIKFKILVF